MRESEAQPKIQLFVEMMIVLDIATHGCKEIDLSGYEGHCFKHLTVFTEGSIPKKGTCSEDIIGLYPFEGAQTEANTTSEFAIFDLVIYVANLEGGDTAIEGGWLCRGMMQTPLKVRLGLHIHLRGKPG